MNHEPVSGFRQERYPEGNANERSWIIENKLKLKKVYHHKLSTLQEYQP